MKFDVEYIEKLAKILNEASLTEISLEDGEQAITIRKELIAAPVATAVSAPVQAAITQAAPASTPVAEVKKGKPITSRWLELSTHPRPRMLNPLLKLAKP